MNSLTSIEEILKKWDGLKNCLNLISSSRDYPLDIEGVQGSFFSFLVKEICKTSHFKSLQASQYQNSSKSAPAYEFISSDMLLVLPSEKDAIEISQDLQTICPDYEIYTFPGTGTVPYRPMAKGSVVFGQRAGVLSNLIYSKQQITFNSKARIFIFTQRSFLSFLPPPSYLKDLSFELKKDDLFDTVEIAKKLSQIGYTRVPKVNVRGEFSLRGEVLDIFLPNDQNAIRIVFDFDQIKELKYFDVSDQVTINSLSKIIIYPCKEVIWNDELVSKLEDKLNEYDKNGIEESINPSGPEADVHLKFTQKALEFKENLINQLRTCGEAEGEELFYNLLWDKQYTILDYISQNSYIIFYDYNRLVNGQLTIEREYNGMYRRAREELCVLPPSKILNNFDQLQKAHEKSILFKSISTELSENSKAIKLETNPSRSFFGNINFMKDELTKLQKDKWNIFIFTDNENQKLRINEIFKDFTNPDLENPVMLIPDKLSSGFSIPELKLIVIQENEIFGRRKYVSKTVNKARSSVIDTFVELNPGDYVVHVNWGIGKFLGIERVKSLGNERDYIKLQYADEEFAFVPIEQVNLVQRYIGNEGENPRLDRIGSKSWESRKNKVREAVEELAQKLIDLYSRRKASVGYAFPKETEWQAAFEAAFPYEDTPDQILVTEQIKEDMEKPVPMDRLVCGDVGYGKTEIAMRAAFKAVMGGKQVAFLAPTTILAEQHYDNCKERFKNFPVKIERMSRFVSPAEQKKILAKTAAGEVDILVGTHRIIQKDVKFKNLGLMIIDEEQRFGVKDKEKLKVMKNNIDCLTMSATPIPRTLHMSLLKIRDMSLLTTPPHNRQAIETVIDEYSDERVAMAINREIERGGQVFYLHNRVESLTEIRKKIEQICPSVLVDIAHGQMTSNELDDIFHRFKMGGFHVLIATTIIENGIDIPNVNTIIIDRADMYGVSQLYQLRGRVGRSDRKAYAYLLYPENKALSEVAMKRLQVISDFTELGSGFKIAMKDMEIRGAGNLLGRDQSGDVYSVGFDLYVKLLNEAVNRLMSQNDYQEQSEVLMELEYTGFIPDTYILNPQIKMEIYKKIAAVTTDEEFDAVLGELNDRFGPIPDEVSSLLALAEIRILCRKLSVSSIKEKKGEVKIEFKQTTKINIDKLLRLISENPDTVKMNPTQPNAIFIMLGKIGLKEKSEFIREKLSKLQ
jgi:transcription-repair coupling factor (superfamily II helicase)